MAAGTATPPLQPWDYPVPRFLYKYFPPGRFHILTDCRVRFTQRHLFPDDREFRPEVRDFGTEQELRAFMAADELFRQLPGQLQDAVVQRLLTNRAEQRRVADIAQSHMKTPDAFVTLCLTEKPESGRMWEDYADHRRGFVIEFDTGHPGFSTLARPGLLGKVSYADEPLRTFLGEYGAAAFFRKRTRYAFEAEWRSIRAISNFPDVSHEEAEEPVYLSPFNPNCVKRILVQSNSAIELKLRLFVSIDCRYRHVFVTSAT